MWRSRAGVGTLLPVVLVVSVAMGGACHRAPSSKRDVRAALPLSETLRRSGTNAWRTKPFTQAGVSADVPADPCWVDGSKWGLYIHLHAVPPPPGVLDDQYCMLRIRLERMTRAQYEERQEFLRGVRTDPEYRKWVAERHDVISKLDEGEYTYYRYDVECSNGDIVRTRTEVHNVFEDGVSIYAEEDDAMVRRVLESVRCLDRPAPQVREPASPDD
jgi:hypothetical protein